MSESLTTTHTAPLAEKVEQVLIGGDLSRLSPEERVTYYKRVCESIGLNPLTKPFDYITLNGKLVLYAKRDATEQLRKIHAVSVEIVSRERVDDVYVVTARATMPGGRQDESIGAVPLGNLKGEALANAIMKAETKAKRRVTLSICGLGMLDETEVASVPGGYARKPAPAEAEVVDAEPIDWDAKVSEAIELIDGIGDVPYGTKLAPDLGVMFKNAPPSVRERVLRIYQSRMAIVRKAATEVEPEVVPPEATDEV